MSCTQTKSLLLRDGDDTTFPRLLRSPKDTTFPSKTATTNRPEGSLTTLPLEVTTRDDDRLNRGPIGTSPFQVQQLRYVPEVGTVGPVKRTPRFVTLPTALFDWL